MADMEKRIDELMSKMSLEEKASQLLFTSKALPRHGIPEYNWWNECLHGVARAGIATVFPQAIGMAASFDTSMLYRVARAIALEGRSKFASAAKAGNRSQYRGLSFWTPNINIFRDPRWGRGQETYGEDPFLTAALGVAFVKGLQGEDPDKLLTAACAKHYAVHSGPEKDRHVFDAVVSPKDLWETYLPAFEALVEAGVEAVMGAYNRTNGEPCCGSKLLLVDILREKWGFKGHVVSDCWAIRDFHEHHKVTKTAEESAALALKMGCDLNCGCVYEQLLSSVEQGLLTEKDIDVSVRRMMRSRIRLGLLDESPEMLDRMEKETVVNGPQNIALAREAAAKSMVLLKNDGILPLKKGGLRLFATGPYMSDVDTLLGNYFGMSRNLVTFIEGIAAKVPMDANLLYRPGVLPFQKNRNPMDWTSGEVRAADVTLVALGVHPMYEGEEGEALASEHLGDRADIGLPPHQEEFLRMLCNIGKPIVLLLTGGCPVSIPHDLPNLAAVIWVGYPGEQGGNAVADVLFGDINPAGRMPFTVPYSVEQLPPYEDYRMQGRTYRYMTEKPLYPFGFGLSYTRFEYDALQLPTKLSAGEDLVLTVTLHNKGGRDGDEVVQVYLKDKEASVDVPLWQLAAFQRETVEAAGSKKVSLTVPAKQLMVVTGTGERVFEPGEFEVAVGGASPGERSLELGSAKPATGGFELI